jgi:prevent-host-death family protein
MKTTSISEAKNRLSALLELVRHGETVLITDRGRPVARLEPIHAPESGMGDDARLVELERAGLVRRPRRKGSAKLTLKAPPSLPNGVSALKALIEEREQGR